MEKNNGVRRVVAPLKLQDKMERLLTLYPVPVVLKALLNEVDYEESLEIEMVYESDTDLMLAKKLTIFLREFISECERAAP